VCPSASIEVGGVRVQAEEQGRRRPWWLGEATRAYADRLRPAEHWSGLATALVSQHGASKVKRANSPGFSELAHMRGGRRR
jgi:hypothetical protein